MTDDYATSADVHDALKPQSYASAESWSLIKSVPNTSGPALRFLRGARLGGARKSGGKAILRATAIAATAGFHAGGMVFLYTQLPIAFAMDLFSTSISEISTGVPIARNICLWSPLVIDLLCVIVP